MDERTQQQIEADDELNQAIINAYRAYNTEDNIGILVEHVVIANFRKYTESGTPYTATLLLNMDDRVPASNQIGLVSYADVRLRKWIGTDCPDDCPGHEG